MEWGTHYKYVPKLEIMRADVNRVLKNMADAGYAKELVENAAAIGPEHQHHTHQRASRHHTRRHGQGELFGELRFRSLE